MSLRKIIAEEEYTRRGLSSGRLDLTDLYLNSLLGRGTTQGEEAIEWFNEQTAGYRLGAYMRYYMSNIADRFKRDKEPHLVGGQCIRTKTPLRKLYDLLFKPIPSPEEMEKRWEDSPDGKFVGGP